MTALFDEGDLFGWYSIGLAVGFFLYLILGNSIFEDTTWLGSGD